MADTHPARKTATSPASRTAASPAPNGDPGRYIERVSFTARKEIPGPIEPAELLARSYRDQNPVEVVVQFLASQVIRRTGNEERVQDGLRRINALGSKVAEAIGNATGSREVEWQAKRVLGLADRDTYFRFREPTQLSGREVRVRLERLQAGARAALKALGRRPRLRVLLTGATGFLGKEILIQAAADRRIAQVTAVLRPETIRDRRTRQVVKVLSPAERGALLLKRLRITGAGARKFRFVGGDIEKPSFGIAPGELAALKRTVTHVIHCAASVAFDDPYDASFRANVLGCRNALELSLSLQKAKGSPFVQHVAIETSYVHGRKKRSIAQENALAFPRNFYNNYYELTKAMASIETDRFVVEKGLRVTQLLPSIVIGNSRTGNNYGDTKVVNAPINAFGRTQEATQSRALGAVGRSKARLIALIALSFPGDRSAELNLVPVDRVVQGILATLTVPEAIGERIHLATDNRIRSEDIVRIAREELGVNVRLADPTLYRRVTLPMVKAALVRLGEPKLARALDKLGGIFGGYGEWGQPIHDVGNDVRILGLPIRRPSTEHAFRMLCRHNKYVQDFGKVRDADEIAYREHVWAKVMDDIEYKTGREVGSLGAEEFRKLLMWEVDLRSFTRK